MPLIFIALFVAFHLNTAHCAPRYLPGFPEFKEITANSTQETYPNVNSSGFVEMKISGRDYTDDIDKLDTIRQDSTYKKIPNDIMKGTPKLENRYNINLEGQLDETTEIKYNIQKEPDFPGVYNVYIRKNTTELQFGDFNSEYVSGQFINVNKYLNGVETNTYQPKWKGKATLGKEKSEPQKFETFGTGIATYKLGKSFVLEGSVTVYVNNQKLREDLDYTVDYYSGAIQFKNALSKTDYIKVIYEFTNPIQDFITALSRKNFTGAHYSYNPSQNITEQSPIIISGNAYILIKDQDQVLSNRISLPNTPVILGSETVRLNSKILNRGTDYYIKNDSGLIRFSNRQLSMNDAVGVEYQYTKTNTENELLFGENTRGPYKIKHPSIIKDSLVVKLGQSIAKEYIDYYYKESTNSIYFYYNVYSNQAILMTYKYNELEEKKSESIDTPFSVSVTYIDETTSVRENLTTYKENDDPLFIDGVLNNIIVLKNNPIDSSKPITVMINGKTLNEAEYTINPYEGTIRLNSEQNLTSEMVKVSYYYLTSLNSEHSLKGLGTKTYNQNQLQLRSLPVKYNGIQKITIYNPDETILEENRDYTVDYFNDETQFTDIHISFILGNNSILSETGYPNSSDTIKIDYLYTPSIDETRAESKHTVTDVLIRKKMNDKWEINTEIANSNYNFSKTSEFKKELFVQPQENNIYKLQQKSIEENSEMIFINGFSQTKDLDYYINYEQGEVTFINKTIPENQKIEIAYNYYKSNTPNKKNVNAYAVESGYQISENLKISNAFNVIDPNFLPIGNVNLNKGSQKSAHQINWNISQNESAALLYQTEKIHDIFYVTKFKKDSYLSTIKFNAYVFETDHKIQFDDVTSTQNYSENTHKLIKYDQDIRYNFWDDQIELSNTISQKNEELTPSKNSNSINAGTKVSFKNNFNINNFIKTGNIDPYYSVSVTKKNTNDITNYSSQKIQSVGLNSLVTFTDTIFSNNTFDKSDHFTAYENAMVIKDSYYNYSHLTNFQPLPFFNSSLNIAHNESVSPIPGQENKVEDRNVYTVSKLANDAFLEYFRTPQWIIAPFNQSFSSFNYTKSKKRENNYSLNYKENRYFGSINNLQFIDGFKLPKFKFEKYNTFLTDTKKTSYQWFNSSETSYYSYDTGFTYQPNVNHLNRLQFNSNFSQSQSNGLTQIDLISGTKNVTTSLITKNNQNHNVGLKLPNIPVLITTISRPTFRYEHKLATSIEENQTKSTDVSQNSFILDNKFVSSNAYSLSYNIFSFFNLNTAASNEESYFNRNRRLNSTGSLFRENQIVRQEIGFQLFKIFNNKELFKYEKITETKNSAINLTPDQLKANFNNQLMLNERLANHTTEIKLSQWFSINSELEYQDFTQNLASKNAYVSEEFFNQNKGGLGIEIRPLSGLSMSYDYSIKHLKSTRVSSVSGNKDFIKLTYNPIKYENFQIQIQLTKEKNWGYGFNSLQKAQLMQTSNESLNINIINRDDEVYLGSFNLNVVLPINNSEHLEKIVFSGEGYYKKIIDRLDSKNEIMINGLLFNIRIEL